MQKRCSTSPKTYNVERSCIETKCKIAGLFDSNNDKPAVVVNMGKVEYNGKNLELNVGEDANAQTA